MVFSLRPSSSRRLSTRPTLKSRFSIMASAHRVSSSRSRAGSEARKPIGFCRNRCQYSLGTAQGECGVLNGIADKRAGMVHLDEGDCVIGQIIGDESLAAYGFPVAFERRVKIFAPMAGGESVILVE